VPYTPTDWIDLTTPLSAQNFNFMGTQYAEAMADGGIPYASDAGAVNAIAATISPAPTAYTDGLAACIKIANTTTGATTLDLNGLGAVAVKNGDGSAVGAGDLVAGVPVNVRYVGGGSPAFIASGSGGLSGAGDAVAADVRITKTFTSAGGRDQTGALVDNGNGPTVNPSVTTQTLTAGIWDTPITVNPVTGDATTATVLAGSVFSSGSGINQTGAVPVIAGGNTITPTAAAQTAIASATYTETAITVAGDPNLIGANIAPGKSIFGVAGAFAPKIATGTATSGSQVSAFYLVGGGTDSLPFVIIPVPTGANEIYVVTTQGVSASTGGYADGASLTSLASVSGVSGQAGSFSVAAGASLQLSIGGIQIPAQALNTGYSYTVYYA